MSEGLIDMILQSADYDILTATPQDVLTGKKFVGLSGATYDGEMPDRGSPDITLGLNDSVTLPQGNYNGGTVGQHIATMNGYDVTPGSKQITIPTRDLYMTRDIYIGLLKNLVPENIKLGEYVGGVGPGTWQGYVVTNPNTFYYRGTFGSGQSLSNYIVRAAPDDTLYTGALVQSNELKDIKFTCENLAYKRSSYLTFNLPTDLTTLKRLTIEYSFYKSSTSTARLFFTAFLCTDKYNEYYNALDNNFSKTEFKTDEKDTENKLRRMEIDLSSFSRSAYLSFFLQVARKDDIFYLHSVKFE